MTAPNFFHAFISKENGEYQFYWQAQLDLEIQGKLIKSISKQLRLMKEDYNRKIKK